MIPVTWKKEFRMELLGLVYNQPEKFTRSQWQKDPDVKISYLVYRWLAAAYFLATLILSIFDTGREKKRHATWPIYLTNWGYTVCTVQAFLAAFLLTRALGLQKREEFKVQVETKLTKTTQLYWILHTIGVVMAFSITATYWAAVYNPAADTPDTLNILFHVVNSVLMAIDFVLVSHPFRLLHCYWPAAFTSLYVVFSIVYFELGGLDYDGRSYIYKPLNWNKPLRAVIASMCGICFTIAVHCTTWFLYLVRQWLFGVCIKEEPHDEATNGFVNEGATLPLNVV